MAWLWRGCKSGEIQEGIRRQVVAELRRHFRPEFLSRVDDAVLFKPLTLADIKRILELTDGMKAGGRATELLLESDRFSVRELVALTSCAGRPRVWLGPSREPGSPILR
jgi:hypothetical protein